IGRLKMIPAEQTHRLVAGLRFSDKLKLLRSLLDQSHPANLEQLREFLDRIENDSLRNVFAHSFLASDTSSVTFYHRESPRRGEYSCYGYRFLADNFVTHVQEFAELTHNFERALEFSQREIGEFASQAIPEQKTDI